jgi:poly(3-hydroxyalkanoate) synthetase
MKLSEIKVPVLIIVGKKDRITPPSSARWMYEKIQNAKLSIIEHAGHLPNMENPREFNIQLKKFLTSLYQPVMKPTRKWMNRILPFKSTNRGTVENQILLK